MKYFYYFIIVTLLFIVYIEYSVGGILFRQNSLGKISLNIRSLLSYLIHPLYNRFLWNLKLLDVNYPFIISISTLIYYMFIFSGFIRKNGQK